MINAENIIFGQAINVSEIEESNEKC